VLRAALEHEESESRRAHEAAARERQDGARRLAEITAECEAQTTAADEARRALAQGEAFRATRRYRLAARLAAPLDRVRRGRRRG
jgi:hypothetical protein